ncbi:MAG TPA: PIN domain-containing protein [Thermodesulfobacteriota bacterium]|nr:PIN domain-containing protein [Thermodesulfobacteriota bacterium]
MTIKAKRIKAVLNTNVFVAAYLSKNPKSPTIELLDRWRKGEFAVLYCEDLEREIIRKLLEKGISPSLIQLLISDFFIYGKEVNLSSKDVYRIVPADPEDDFIVACALKGKATHIVTYDPHIKELGESYRGIKILEPIPLLKELRKQKLSKKIS